MVSGRRMPLSVALSRALMAFEADYDTVRQEQPGLPALPYYANLLRVLDARPVPVAALPELTVVTERAIRVSLAKGDRAGWVDVCLLPGYKSRRQASLTTFGIQARDAAARLIERTTQQWIARFGADCVQLLRECLQTLVSQLELELAHYPSGYGQGDPRVTGGAWLPAEAGPLGVPPRGAEWPVVRRSARADAVPLPALLSQALMAFTIVYESDGEGWLFYDANVLQHVPDDGIPLESITADANLSGTGRSTLERHRMLYVELDPDRPGKKRVRLRRRGRALRDRYPDRLQQTEAEWRHRFGSKAVASLHDALQGITRQIDGDWPDHPPVIRWLSQKYEPCG
jgi:hypothetical protein